MANWEDLKINPKIIRTLTESMELAVPTPIQQTSIPAILSEVDILLKSQTGSGKTLAFLIPVLQRLQESQYQRSTGTVCIILAPTRELCLQIYNVATRLFRFFPTIVPGAITGGEKMKSQKARLRKGIAILVATPGRLLDHLLHTQAFLYRNLRWLILDEADRLLDMGFEKDITAILNHLNKKQPVKKSQQPLPKQQDEDEDDDEDEDEEKESKENQTKTKNNSNNNKSEINDTIAQKRQNILVSATLERGVSALAELMLQNPLFIQERKATLEQGEIVIKSEVEKSDKEQASVLPEGLRTFHLQVESRHRLVALTSLLRSKIKTYAQHYAKESSTPAVTKKKKLNDKQSKIKKEEEKQPRTLKAVVFFSTCASVDFHQSLFTHPLSTWPPPSQGTEEEKKTYRPILDIPVWKLHGNLPQTERVQTYNNFIKSNGGILLCTDVAARGLDLPNIDWIIQYDPPEQPAEYIHRVGRTARAGGRGRSVVFLTSSELPYLEHLDLKNSKGEKVALPGIDLPALFRSLDHPQLKLESSTPTDTPDPDSDTTKSTPPHHQSRRIPPAALLHRHFEYMITHLKELTLSAEEGFQAYVRAYAAYPKLLKKIFHIKFLHLGHIARSFALKEKPSDVTGAKNKNIAIKQKNERDKKMKGKRLEGEQQQKLLKNKRKQFSTTEEEEEEDNPSKKISVLNGKKGKKKEIFEKGGKKKIVSSGFNKKGGITPLNNNNNNGFDLKRRKMDDHSEFAASMI